MTIENEDSEVFSLGAGYEDTKPAAEEPPALLPKSKAKYKKGEDGETHAEYTPVYLVKLARPATKQPSRFDANESVLSLRLVTVGKVKVGESSARHFSVFDDIPEFPTDEEIKAKILSDDDIPEGEKEERIEKRLKGQKFAKRRVVSLLKAIAPSTLASLQEDEAEGFEVGIAVGVRKWDGGAANTIEKYLPASEATAGKEKEGEGDGI